MRRMIAVAGLTATVAALGVLTIHGADAKPGISSATTLAKPVAIKVYKSPTCGCCKSWIEHLEKNGFVVESVNMSDLSAVKEKYGVKPELRACHTAIVGNYVVEGHVPADVIRKLLAERPEVAGIAVPGMPVGSPGMEGAFKQHYDVLSFDKNGRTRVYTKR